MVLDKYIIYLTFNRYITIFIVYQIFTSNVKFVPNLTILFALLAVLFIKLIVIILLHENAKSELLIESYKESKTDFISTCVVMIVLILSFYVFVIDYSNCRNI